MLKRKIRADFKKKNYLANLNHVIKLDHFYDFKVGTS